VKYIYVLVCAVLFISCKKELSNSLQPQSKEISFISSISGELTTKAIGTSWTVGDQIGVYMLQNNKPLEPASILENINNRKFTHSSNGSFTTSQAAYFPIDKQPVDFIAYYPYQEVSDFRYKIDLSDQSNQELLDLMYADNAKGLSPENGTVPLVFERQLVRIRLEVDVQTGSTVDLTNMQANAIGFKTKGNLQLANKTLEIDQHSETPFKAKLIESNATKALIELTVFPGLTSQKEGFILQLADGKSYTWHLPNQLNLVQSNRYIYQITLTGTGSVVVPQPTNGYFETPILTDGGSIKYIQQFLPENPNKRNFSMLYDNENRLAYWVAYPLHSSYLGSAKRTNAWAFDPWVSQSFQPTLKSGWGASTGFDRGHQMPSADRTYSDAGNRTTFYYTNMTAQVSSMNQKIWARLEEKVREWTATCDTMYVVTGAMIQSNTDKTIRYVKDNANKDVAIPKYYFKALAMKKGNVYYTAAYKMDNSASISNDQVNTYRISVKELEEQSGFTFFPTLTQDNKAKVESNLWQ